jgi:integrase
MPKQSKYPRLRVHIRRGKGGQVWTSYSYDMRGTGRPDVALGTDYAAALVEWAKLRDNLPRIRGTIEEAFAQWEQECLPEYANETTRRNYAQNLKRLRPVFGPATWDSVRVSTIAEYLRKRTAKVQANREKALLSVVWGKAREWELTALPFPAYKMRLKNPESPQDVEVSQAAFDAVYQQAPQFLKDAMDVASATGLRVRDVISLRLVSAGKEQIAFTASKTGKRGAFDLAQSPILHALVRKRRESKAPHVFLLTHGNMQVTERMLTDAWARARSKALPDCPEVEGLMLRHMRKFAAQQAGSLQEAQQLLQHGSAATTARHYRGSEKLRPVR